MTPQAPQKLLHSIDLNAGGVIALPEPIANESSRDIYYARSLVEEAITSSQLEGASTTRLVAKEMLRTRRPPRDKSERMILNNYRAMQRIGELRDQPLNEQTLLELHRIVGEGTLDKPDAIGRFRRPDETVNVEDEYNVVLHVPPHAQELPERMGEMIRFANGETPGYFVHPVLRAILLHFWLGCDYPFVDGNGRTARALFYWCMMRSKYWLFEYISISSLIRKAPVQYGMAFLHAQTDDNDATYFINHQLGVIERAIKELHAYVSRKTGEVRSVEALLRDSDEFNHRQVEMLRHAVRHPGESYTIEGHCASHRVAYATGRADLLGLEKAGLVTRRKSGKAFVFRPIPGLEDVLRARRASG